MGKEGMGREFGHLQVTHKAESIGFLLKVLEPFLRSFQTVRDAVLV